MNILNTVWARGVMGIGVAALIISGASMVYPMTATNLAGHILGWIMAGVIGIKITLSALEQEDNWMEGPSIPEEKVAEKKPAILGRVKEAAFASARLEPRDRLSWKPKEAATLEYPAGLDRGRGIDLRTSFHFPVNEEKEECIRFAAENPICFLATIDDQDTKKPRVRTVFLWRADNSGFYFVLFSSKNVSRQIKAQPNVELCFQNHPRDISTAKQLRVNGQLDLLEDKKLKEEASQDRSILNTLAGEGKNANIEVYHLSDYEMKFWQMGTIANRVNAKVATH